MSPFGALLGKRLREARNNRRLSQEVAADTAGLSRPALIQIEMGERHPTVTELVKLAELYHVSATSLLAEEEEAEAPLVVLCRISPELFDDPAANEEIYRYAEIFKLGIDLEKAIGEPVRPVPHSYQIPAPSSFADAVEQGRAVAVEERRRLNLGFAPIQDVAGLISAQGVWAAAAKLPDQFSGLFLAHCSLGTAILVNSRHARVRRRFSYAHEYAHALVDRTRSATVTGRHNADELIEKRANAFASEFLMPSGAVREALDKINKGGASREYFGLFDVANDTTVHGEKRNVASHQRILPQDVELLAHTFQVSFQVAAYKLLDMRCVTRDEVKELIEKRGHGGAYFSLFGLTDPETGEAPDQPYLTGQIGRLAIEAFRREVISNSHIQELCSKAGIDGEALLAVARFAGE